MDGNEIDITLSAVAVSALIILIQLFVVNMRQKTLEHDEVLFRQVESGQCDDVCFGLLKQKLLSNHYHKKQLGSPDIALQVILNLVIFASLSVLTLYLSSIENLEKWSILAGVCALSSLAMPFVVWHRTKECNLLKNRLLDEVGYYEALLQTQGKPVPLEKMAPAAPYLAKAVSEPAAVSLSSVAALTGIPEDSILRRHYLTQRQAEADAIQHPYPTDSILLRHHQAISKQALKSSAKKEANSVKNSVSVSPEFKPAVPQQPQSTTLLIPEDSILRRHFFTTLYAEIESTLGAKPTDSILKRHHVTLVQAKLDKYLSNNS